MNTIYRVASLVYSKENESSRADAVRQLLREIRLFQGRGYVFAYSLDGIIQAYPPDLAIEGTNWIDIEDGAGKKIARDMIELVKTKDSGFIEYIWPFPDKLDTEGKKIAYVRLFKPLGWIIGFGDYAQSIEDKGQEDTLELYRQGHEGKATGIFILDRKMKLAAGSGPHADIALDPEIKQRISEIDRETLRKTGDFFKFSFTPKGTNKKIPMMVFVRAYSPWNWIIGQAVNLEKIFGIMREQYRQHQKEVIEEMVIFMSLLFLAGGILFFVGKKYAGYLEKNMGDFETFFKKAGRSMEQINLENVRFMELKALGAMANEMVTKRAETQIALEAANRRLKELADKDGLTRVANRRFFDRTLQKEWDRAFRGKNSIVLGMLDIDHFKQYNDTYGHQQGDTCLQKMAAALSESVHRPADLVARYGGEEFVILLPDTGLSGGQKVAERIQEKVKELAMAHIASDTGIVSFSMGLAQIVPTPVTRLETLMLNADKALYIAKENGRNRIEIYKK